MDTEGHIRKLADNLDLLLTRDQVQARFGITRRFLELAAWRGDGPPMVKLTGRSVRYRLGDVKDWIATRRVTPAGSEG